MNARPRDEAGLTAAGPHAVADATVSCRESAVFTSPNKLKLGVFGANLSGGCSGISSDDGHLFMGSWADTEEIAIQADRAGFEVLVPISRWKGFGGESGYWDRSYETLAWAGAIARATERIVVFSTCVVPAYNPAVAAKMGATLDHISGGRWGLNIVAGWLGSEFNLFGLRMNPRAERYAYAQEWFDVVNRLWSDPAEFDFDGKYFQLKAASSLPKPMQHPRPPVMNAGQSAEGLEFAARNADMIFIGLADTEASVAQIKDIRARAERLGRDVGIWSNLDIVVGDSEKDVRDLEDQWARRGDLEAAANYAAGVMGNDSASQDFMRTNPELLDMLVRTGGNKHIAGTPVQIVEQIAKFQSLGIDGMTFTFHNYGEGIQRYRDDLYPLLVQLGLRT